MVALSRDVEDLLKHVSRETLRLAREHLDLFSAALEEWLFNLLSAPLPSDWKQRLAQYLALWAAQGYEVDAKALLALEHWIEGWARTWGLEQELDTRDLTERPATSD